MHREASHRQPSTQLQHGVGVAGNGGGSLDDDAVHVQHWLRARRLGRFFGPLAELGVECLEDLLQVTPSHLETVGMKVLHIERFMQVRRGMCGRCC